MRQNIPDSDSRVSITPAQLLAQVRRALFGERWKADMAQAINVRTAIANSPFRVSVDRIDD